MSQQENFYCEFDETTKTKLVIFEKYIESWLPVFIRQKKYMYIFDFFAGPGYDSKGNAGSPIITLNQIKKYISIISNTKIYLFFNDKEKKNIEILKTSYEKYLESNPDLKVIVNIEPYSEEFENAFEKLKNKIGEYPSLVFMDQFGIKYTAYIKEFENFKVTDFLIFISSSSLRRFAETPEFKRVLTLSDNEIEKLKNTPYKLITECVVKIFKERLSGNLELRLYCFSLKKGKNIYGLLFGTKHPAAVDKFLNIVWKLNPDNGTANYDIYDDKTKKQASLYPDLVGKTTVQAFKDKLREKIMNDEIKTNEEAYNFTIENGFIPKFSKEVLKELKKSGKIFYKGSPLINYKKIYVERKIISYEKNKD